MLWMCLCACAIVKEIKERDVKVSSCIHKKEGKRERERKIDSEQVRKRESSYERWREADVCLCVKERDPERDW